MLILLVPLTSAVLTACSMSTAGQADGPSSSRAVLSAAVDPHDYALTEADLTAGNSVYGDLPAVAFDSPSRTIQCFIAGYDSGSGTTVQYTCQLQHHSYSVTKPVWLNCEGAVYSGVAITGIGSYRPEFPCRPPGESATSLVPQVRDAEGNLALPRAGILPSGRSIALSGVTCSVSGRGTGQTVRCDRGGKAGFSISTSHYSLTGPERKDGAVGGE